MSSNAEFIINDYNNAKAFASFLPAIAGIWGKPLWAYYVNRGQAISNFGVRDKDGAMLEFVAANKAWRQTALQGFRTFYKIKGHVSEPFRNYPDLKQKRTEQTMYIKPHSVRLFEQNKETGIDTEVTFCTLPNENFPALLRRLIIKNTSDKPKEIECIDGLPMLIPWGTRNWMLKNLSRLGEGWFAGADYSVKGVPYYKLPVEALDRPEIVPLTGAHFYCGSLVSCKSAEKPRYCIDPDSVFGRQMDFDFPAAFMQNDSFVIDPGICGKNKTPSAMGYFTLNLEPGACAQYYSITGHCSALEDVDLVAALIAKDQFFENKEKENEELINSITSCAWTESSNKNFNAYCSQNFLDNALRGGFPLDIGAASPYYAYSRVHGDMEREYNNFDILSEYFSQGNANYRDINQNRRCDIFFNRNTADGNIHYFMNLIQIDGFNPLKILGVRFTFESEESKKNFLKDFAASADKLDKNSGSASLEKISKLISAPVTIGSLFNCIEENKISLKDRNAVLLSFLKNSKKSGLAEHGEGYWSDHWHYNTDLIENYLAVFPDRLKELLLDRRDYTYYDDCYFVEPRNVKYLLFRGMPRQMRGVNKDPEKAALIGSRTDNPHAMRTDFGKGSIYYTSLLAKLLCIIANKYASLDPEALGIEMESDKPNWCDALNGLPGLFGSSSAESLELLRLVSLLKHELAGIAPDTNVLLCIEVVQMLDELAKISSEAAGDFDFWDKTHIVKENFRELTRLGISGKEENCTIKRICEWLDVFEQKLLMSKTQLEKIAESGVIPTCFEFIPVSYRVLDDAELKLSASTKTRLQLSAVLDNQAGATAAMKAIAGEKTQNLQIESFKRRDLPLFLEGPVHYLRLCPQPRAARDFHKSILASPLYDKKLDMIKINAPIASAGQDIGRITVFSPGWLENESIWLHMEYKYLFELLRNDMAGEFFSLAKTALVPFFNPDIYGRSIYENCSFIVSSAHPDKTQHGQGFVARLSGATAEFISMWIAFTSGLKPFSMSEKGLCLSLRPLLPAEFFTENNTFAFNFLGTCRVVYCNASRKDTFGPDAAQVKSYHIKYIDGTSEDIVGNCIYGKSAAAIRDGKAASIEVLMGC